jgi:hypothetical protein
MDWEQEELEYYAELRGQQMRDQQRRWEQYCEEQEEIRWQEYCEEQERLQKCAEPHPTSATGDE